MPTKFLDQDGNMIQMVASSIPGFTMVPPGAATSEHVDHEEFHELAIADPIIPVSADVLISDLKDQVEALSEQTTALTEQTQALTAELPAPQVAA